jgi:hypothetical protein
MCKLRFLATVVIGGLLMLSGEMSATTITTTSFSTWESSTYTVSGSQVELSFVPVNSANYSYSTSSGITLTPSGNPSIGFLFTGPDNSGYVLNGTSYNGLNALAGASDGVGVIKVATPSGGENAILLGVGCTGTCSGSTPLTLTLSDGEIFAIANGLFGLSISHNITWVTLSAANGSRPVVDDFWYGTSAEAQDSQPQPAIEGATLILISGGLLVIFGFRRKLGKRSLGPEYSRDIVAET